MIIVWQLSIQRTACLWRHRAYDVTIDIPNKKIIIMAANGLINKEKLRKTHLCFGNDFPRKISSYWRDYGPDTRIPCPLPSIGHRPQTPVEVRYIRYIKFFFWSQILHAHIQVKTLKVTLSCAFYIVHVYIHVPSTLLFIMFWLVRLLAWYYFIYWLAQYS